MSDREVTQIKQHVEQAPVSRDGHHHNLENAYQEISRLQNQDGGINSPAFRQDMQSLNRQLHAEGLLPNMDIVGVDQSHHCLITRDIADHENRSQAANNVNDFGLLGSGRSQREAADAAMARMMGLGPITRNPDGSYDVPMPDQRDMTAGVLGAILGGMVPGPYDRERTGSAPFGMNAWQWQAWRGWSPERNENQ